MDFSILLLVNRASASSGCLFIGFLQAQEFSCENSTIILSILQLTAGINVKLIQDGRHKHMDYTLLLLLDIAQTSF